MTTLDSEIDEDVYILKVDVQGWEPHVFAGALKLLQRHKVRTRCRLPATPRPARATAIRCWSLQVTIIVLELSPYTLCEAGFNPMEVVSALSFAQRCCFPCLPNKDSSYVFQRAPGPASALPPPLPPLLRLLGFGGSGGGISMAASELSSPRPPH